MKRTITSEILVSYSQCPRKAYLLLCTNQRGTPNEYMSILQQRKEALQRDYIKKLKQKNPDVQPYSTDSLRNGCELLTNATLKVEGLEAECGILTKVGGSSALGKYGYEPTLFIGTNKIDKYQKLALFFVGYVLEQIQGTLPVAGRIIGMNEKSHKVKLESSSKVLVPILEQLHEWVDAPSSDPPTLILNKQCDYCQFQRACKDEAEKEDHLSLLDAISTPKVVRRYEKKGIFTVKQLSYLFKPRKRKKRNSKSPPIHRPELQALAIRTGKIYLEQLPELSRKPIELFLDIEGIPDQQFYYLIGLLVCEGKTCTQYSFWADTPKDEIKIWQQFLEKVNHYPDAPIYHYGSYDSRAIAQLARRYEIDEEPIKNRCINANSYIYSKVYFPVRSNRLKEIGGFIGASWTSPNASGLQSLVWRHHWNKTQNTEYRELLLTYNSEDCQALKLLTDELSRIKHSAAILSEVDFANKPKRHATQVGQQLHSQFGAILTFAYTNYDRNKISFQSIQAEEVVENKKKKRHGKKGYHGQRKKKVRATKVVQVPPRRTCPKHETEQLRPRSAVSRRTIIDLVITRSGIRKTITEYVGTKTFCPECRKHYLPSGIDKYYKTQLYGHGFRAWTVYQRVALRMTYSGIAEVMKEQFGEEEPKRHISSLIRSLSKYYAETEEIIIKDLLRSPFIHADETSINMRGVNQYVWVFTDGKYVVFKFSETREAAIAHDFLTGYNGVLISDFYSGYDSVKCRQ